MDSGLAERVVEAFQQISPSDEKLVRVLLENPGASSKELTAKLGWKDQAWRLHFDEMCQKRKDLLEFAPFEPKRNAPFYCGILANFDAHTRGFKMKTEAVEGFRRLGLGPAPASGGGHAR